MPTDGRQYIGSFVYRDIVARTRRGSIGTTLAWGTQAGSCGYGYPGELGTGTHLRRAPVEEWEIATQSRRESESLVQRWPNTDEPAGSGARRALNSLTLLDKHNERSTFKVEPDFHRSKHRKMGILNVVQVVLLGHDANMDARRALGITIASYLASEKVEVSGRALLSEYYAQSTTPHRQTAIPLTIMPRESILHPSLFQGHVVRNTPGPSVPRCYPSGLSATTFQQMRAFAKQFLCTKEACPSRLASFPNLCVHPY